MRALGLMLVKCTAVSVNWEFLFVGVLLVRGLRFGVYVKAPDLDAGS